KPQSLSTCIEQHSTPVDVCDSSDLSMEICWCSGWQAPRYCNLHPFISVSKDVATGDEKSFNFTVGDCSTGFKNFGDTTVRRNDCEIGSCICLCANNC